VSPLTFVIFKGLKLLVSERERVMFKVSVSTQADAVPDPPGGLRYCKQCKDWLPIDNFPCGKRRYCCKAHRWEKSGKQARRKQMADSKKQLLFTLWVKAYSDSKRFKPALVDTPTKYGASNNARVNISQKEIEQLLRGMVESYCLTSTKRTMYEDLTELGKTTAIVPISPTELVSISNAVLVPSVVKRHLFKAFKLDGVEGYVKALHTVETHPNTVFRPSVEQLSAMQETLVSKNDTDSKCLIKENIYT
jgi:hypothetical protein